MEKGISDVDLWKVTKGKNMSLRKFITSFKDILVKITSVSHSVALKNIIWHESSFWEELIVNKPTTNQNALDGAINGMEAEEDKLQLSKRIRQAKLNVGCPTKKTEPK